MLGHGGFVPWMAFEPVVTSEAPWSASGQFVGSGRDALLVVVAAGRRDHGWRRLWVPGYYCHEALRPLVALGLELVAYEDVPGDLATADFGRLAMATGDAVVTNNLLGLRGGAMGPALPDGVGVVEDHSHDPWSPWAHASTADYCFASLRKTLPLPDGGVAWSPGGDRLDPPTAGPRDEVIAPAVQALLLKSLPAASHAVDDGRFLALHDEAERRLGAIGHEVAAVSPLSETLAARMPAGEWRATRRRNFDAAAAILHPAPGIRLLEPDGLESVPVVVAVLIKDEGGGRRDTIRRVLGEQRVFTAVLWPLDDPVVPVTAAERHASGRILCLQCDMRFTEEDMVRAAEIVAAAVARVVA